MDEFGMSNLHLEIQAYIESHEMFTARDLLVVAISGGVDSVALLLSLHALGYPLRAYHLHHGLRGASADADADFCKSICTRYGIPITIEHKDVAVLAKAKGVSFETMGRILRYEGLAKVVQGARREREAGQEFWPGRDVVVVTGHHAGDAAETFVMNVLRGAGLDGLTSIQPVTERIVERRNWETGFRETPVRFRIARPLLAVSKSDLQQYVRDRGETWCEDATNTDLRYLRNRVRQSLREEDIKMISRTIALVSEDRAYIEARIDALEAQYLKVCIEDGTTERKGDSEEVETLPRNAYVLLSLGDETLHPVEFGRLVRRAVRRMSGHIVDLSKKDVEAISRLSRTGSGLEVAGRVLVYRSYEGLEFRVARDLLPMVSGAASGTAEVQPQNTPDRRRREWKNAQLLGETEDYRVWGEKMRIEEKGTRTKKSEETPYGWVYYFDADSVSGTLTVRTRMPGDRMIPLGMKTHKKVKDVLIDAKVDVRVRDRLALVQDEEKLCLVGGVRMSEEVKMRHDTKQLWKIMVERKPL